MAESAAKRPRVAEEKVAAENQLEKEAVIERINAGRRLIKVNTNPPTYLNTLIIPESHVLTTMSFLNLKENTFEKNDFDDRCMVCLPHEGISRNVWILLNSLLENLSTHTATLAEVVNDTLLDDIFYICNKNDIPLRLILDKPTKLMAIIGFIRLKKHTQHFPKTRRILGVDEYYKMISKNCADQMARYSIVEEKKSYLATFECIPPLHHAITSELVSRVFQRNPDAL